MANEVKEILEGAKPKMGRLQVPYSKKAKKNLVRQQGRYMQMHGKKITIKILGGLLLESATLPE